MHELFQRRDPVAVDDRELIEYLDFARRLANAAGAVTLPYFRMVIGVDNKAGKAAYDPVTVADRAAESAVRELIERVYPECGIFGEEHGYRPGPAGLTWVIDPIDGTRAFITGMPLWGTLIALFDGEKPILGLMDQPYTGERFVGSRLGAVMQGGGKTVSLHTRECSDLSRAVLYTTHPNLFTTERERNAFKAVERRVRLSRYGGDCYNYCMLAHGFLDLVIEAGLKPYDVQALIPIVEAAGGMLTTWSGDPAEKGGQVIAAGDPRLHAQALELLAGAMDSE